MSLRRILAAEGLIRASSIPTLTVQQSYRFEGEAVGKIKRALEVELRRAGVTRFRLSDSPIQGDKGDATMVGLSVRDGDLPDTPQVAQAIQAMEAAGYEVDVTDKGLAIMDPKSLYRLSW